MVGEYEADIRCRCGNMMGRKTVEGIQVKCRRCKRIHTIPRSIIDQYCAAEHGKHRAGTGSIRRTFLSEEVG